MITKGINCPESAAGPSEHVGGAGSGFRGHSPGGTSPAVSARIGECVPCAQEDGWILVDCGVNVPSVLSAYELAGIEGPDIRQIILTHVHPDHSGLSACIREVSGAPVRMHRNEQEVLRSVSDPEPWINWQDGILDEAGVPREMRHNIRGATRELRSFYPDVAADSYIEHGDAIPTGLGQMQALLTPGHSPGHLCFYFPEKKILLAGDQLLRPNTPHVEWYRDGCALDEFRASPQGDRRAGRGVGSSLARARLPRTDSPHRLAARA